LGRPAHGALRGIMRIWILNHYASPPDRPTGTRHYDFGRVLAGRGHDVTIFASSFNHFSLTEEHLAPGERMRTQTVNGVRFIWVRTSPYSGNDHRRALNMISYAVGALRAQRRLSRPDVVVGSCVHPAAVVAAWLIGAARRAAFVFEVRDLWPQTLIDMDGLRARSPTARALRGVETFLYRRARVVISLLPGAAEYITGLGIPARKIVYVPNGIAAPTAPVTPVADALPLLRRIESWRNQGRLVAGYIGSHGRANRVDVLVRAARALRDRGEEGFAFVFVGDGPERAACERLASDLGLRDALFVPPVPKRAVPSLLQALDATLFTLADAPVFRYGLSSNKLFDYLASGRPVVSACAVPGNPVSASGGGICVPPLAPEAVADALVALASLGTAGRQAMGERGRRWVYKHHDATALADRFLRALALARR